MVEKSDACKNTSRLACKVDVQTCMALGVVVYALVNEVAVVEAGHPG